MSRYDGLGCEVCGGCFCHCERSDDAEYDNDEDEWECAYPGECVMPGLLHHRSECHSAADAEAYYAEVEGIKTDTPRALSGKEK